METKKYMVWFFAGGETDDNKFNVFTGSFIRLMKKVLDDDFDFVKGIYFTTPMMNVAWALNNSQKPFADPGKSRIMNAAFRQITGDLNPQTQLVLVSSSSGSVVAAQAACYLAGMNTGNKFFIYPFHLALGATMISKESDLFRQLLKYQIEGSISSLIYDDLQDEGDSTTGICGTTRREAWCNAFGLMFPCFSGKFHRPSFLNTNPVKGHLHRRRSQTLQKAIDFVQILLINNKLAGEDYCEKAKIVTEAEQAMISLQSLSRG